MYVVREIRSIKLSLRRTKQGRGGGEAGQKAESASPLVTGTEYSVPVHVNLRYA